LKGEWCHLTKLYLAREEEDKDENNYLVHIDPQPMEAIVGSLGSKLQSKEIWDDVKCSQTSKKCVQAWLAREGRQRSHYNKPLLGEFYN